MSLQCRRDIYPTVHITCGSLLAIAYLFSVPVKVLPTKQQQKKYTMASQSQSPIEQQSSQGNHASQPTYTYPSARLISSVRQDESLLPEVSAELAEQLMGNGSPLSAVRSPLTWRNNEQPTRKQWEFGMRLRIMASESEQEPSSNEDAFSRNSKTPAMLMSMSASRSTRI
jgi:hypothetical protein